MTQVRTNYFMVLAVYVETLDSIDSSDIAEMNSLIEHSHGFFFRLLCTFDTAPYSEVQLYTFSVL